MTAGVVLRSFLALLLCVAVALLTLSHASLPPASALGAILGGSSGGKPGLPTLRGLGQSPPRKPSGRTSGQPPQPTPTPAVVNVGFTYSGFPYVPGHIFFTDINHNLEFITGHSAHRVFTGDNASVAPALTPDGKQLAFAYLQRNFSDIYVTTLRYAKSGAVIPMTTTQVTQDAAPPPQLETSPAPPGVFDPRYLWWAVKPAWLPDNLHLLYVSDRPGYDPQNQDNATGSIWEQAVTDPVTNAVRLSTAVAGTGGHDSPGWRPHDAQTYMYVNYYTDVQGAGDGVIEVNTALTGTAPAAAPTDLTPLGATEYAPAWSPNGRSIAFVEDKGHVETDLRVMPFSPPGHLADYNRSVTIERGKPYIVQPFWSPDGRYLGYLRSDPSDPSGNFALVIRRVTYAAHALRFGPAIAIPQAGPVSAEYRPTWGP